VHAGARDITDAPTVFTGNDPASTDVEVVLTNRGAEAAFSAAPAQWQRHSRFVKAARCEADGSFLVRGLPSAEYFLVAVDRLQGSERGGEWQDPAFLQALAPDAERAVLTEGETTTVRLALKGR
jgi:hypothetical protein